MTLLLYLSLCPIVTQAMRFSMTSHAVAEVQMTDKFEMLLQEVLAVDSNVQERDYTSVEYDGGDLESIFRSASSQCRPMLLKPKNLPRGQPCTNLAILVHGFTSCPGLWHFLDNTLRDREYCVLRPLLPGHGRTPIPRATLPSEQKIELGFASQWGFELGFASNWASFVQDGVLQLGISAARRPHGFVIEHVHRSGAVFTHNTEVLRAEGAKAEAKMLFMGDTITRVGKMTSTNGTQFEAHVKYDAAQETLTVVLPMAALGERDVKSLEVFVQRAEVDDDFSSMPTAEDWTRYADFARKLASLGQAFRAKNPEGRLVMAGHSLGGATASEAMVSAGDGVFDNVIILNPAYAVDEKLDWAVKSVGALMNFPIYQGLCSKTRHTFSSGGYCGFTSAHVNGLRRFGQYAYCRILQASDKKSGREFGIFDNGWCTGVLGNTTAGSISPKGHFQIVTSFLDATIDNRYVNTVAERAMEALGDDTVHMCYLKGELGHNFLNEIVMRSKQQDFWWLDNVGQHLAGFLLHGYFFSVYEEEDDNSSGIVGAISTGVGVLTRVVAGTVTLGASEILRVTRCNIEGSFSDA